MESKRNKFIKLAENRTRKAIKDVQLIGNLSNKSSYDYNPDDVNLIFGALESEIRSARQRFQSHSLNSSLEFSIE